MDGGKVGQKRTVSGLGRKNTNRYLQRHLHPHRRPHRNMAATADAKRGAMIFAIVVVIVAATFVKFQTERIFQIKYAPGTFVGTGQYGKRQHIQTQYGADPFHGGKSREKWAAMQLQCPYDSLQKCSSSAVPGQSSSVQKAQNQSLRSSIHRHSSDLSLKSRPLKFNCRS